jgi:hypothetical protein
MGCVISIVCCVDCRLQDVMEQLQQQLPQQHSSVQFAPHPQLPMAILTQGSGPNRIDPAAAGGEGSDRLSLGLVARQGASSN